MTAKQKVTAKQKQFIDGDLLTRVRLALPIARAAISFGLSDDVSTDDTENATVLHRVSELLPESSWSAVPDEALTAMEEYGAAAYALGIAVGVLLRPDAFEKGGAR